MTKLQVLQFYVATLHFYKFFHSDNNFILLFKNGVQLIISCNFLCTLITAYKFIKINP